jgi:molybdate transport system substrate-binding protein
MPLSTEKRRSDIAMFRPFMQATIALLALQFWVSAMAADLIVSAAASPDQCLYRHGHEFERTHPDYESHLQLRRLGTTSAANRKGAPVDVFASADQETMDQAESQGLIETGSRFNFVRNALVVVVPVNSSCRFRRLNN